MTGIVHTSADARLKATTNHTEPGIDTNLSRESSIDTDKVKESMMKIIEIATNGEELENLRNNVEKIELFKTFVNYCLIHFTTSMNWRYKACDSLISDIFTESDEALCILLLENNASDYAKMHREQRTVGRKEARPKYTKVDSMQKRFKGWDRKAIKRFNAIVSAVKTHRQGSHSKNMETELRLGYRRLTGIENVSQDNDNEDSDTDESESDSLDAYDGFVGEITNVTAL